MSLSGCHETPKTTWSQIPTHVDQTWIWISADAWIGDVDGAVQAEAGLGSSAQAFNPAAPQDFSLQGMQQAYDALSPYGGIPGAVATGVSMFTGPNPMGAFLGAVKGDLGAKLGRGFNSLDDLAMADPQPNIAARYSELSPYSWTPEFATQMALSGTPGTPGQGSTFWFEIEMDKQPERAGAGRGELAGARVLLVGFPPAQREPLEQSLTGWGATPVAVASVDEGVNRLVAEISLAEPYHSAVLYAEAEDPHLANRFRRAAPDPAPPAVLAVPRKAVVSRFGALSSGFAAVLELPFDKRQLFNVLHSVNAREEVREGVVRLQDYARPGGTARRLRVLVADDNATNREVLGKILERGGHAALLVNDGEQALEALERERYDAVLLDRNMPGLGGLETLQAIRLMTRGRERLPVMVLSADATPEARRDSLTAGADAFLSKPIEALRLLEELQSLTTAKPGELHRVEPPPRSTAGPAPAAPAQNPIVDSQTLADLEALGSSPGFLEKLVGVFIADNMALLERIDDSLAARNAHELRSLLHAMKGSSASMGTAKLTQLCSALGKLSDAELKLQSGAVLRSLTEEFAAARGELERYLQNRERSAG